MPAACTTRFGCRSITRTGDRAALPEPRQALDDDPALWQRHGDLAQHVQASWLQMIAAKEVLVRECVARKLEGLRAELSGPCPSPLERLLVERVLAGWVQTMYADSLASPGREQPDTAAGRQERLRRQESAQRRYLASIKQLALVRKLLKPGLSPFELARRPGAETNPGVRGRAARPTPPGGSRPGTVLDGQPVLN